MAPKGLGPAYTRRDRQNMVSLRQVRVAWLGVTGPPGVTTLYFPVSAAVPMAAVKAFFTTLAPLLPNAVSVTFPTSGMEIDIGSGQPTGTWTVGAQTGVSGSGGTAFAAPVGGVINWLTGSFVGGRQIRGKTFVVPMATAMYGTNGKLTSTATNAMGSAGTTLATGGNGLTIWSRRNAAAATVSAATAPDKAVVLASRRD